MLLWLDKLVIVIDLGLFTMFSVSVILVDLDLYIDLTLSFLLILGVSTVLFDACDLSVLLTASILCFAELGGLISNPLSNKSDNPIEKVRKTIGDLDETEKALVTTTGMVIKEGNTYMVKKSNMVREAITPPIEKKKIDTVNKTEKSQASNKKVDTSRSKKYEQVKSLYK